MPDDWREPFTNMRFRVEIDGLPETGAVEVIFPEARIVRASRKGAVARYGSLTIKRGLSGSPQWYEWWDAARRSRARLKKNVSIMLLDARGENAARWLFTDTKPVAYHVSSLNALGNEPLIETLELTVGGFRADYEQARLCTPTLPPPAGTPP